MFDFNLQLFLMEITMIKIKYNILKRINLKITMMIKIIIKNKQIEFRENYKKLKLLEERITQRMLMVDFKK